MTTEVMLLSLCSALWCLLIAAVGFGIQRIFSKLDELTAKFSEVADTFRNIYKDMHVTETDIREELAELDRRVVKIETIHNVNGCGLKGDD